MPTNPACPETSSAPPSNPPPKQHTPRAAGDLGMWLFLASLTMLFAASMLAYVIIRIAGSQDRTTWVQGQQRVFPATRPPLGTLDMPVALWISTAILLAASFTMHRALVAVRREKQALFKKMLIATLALSVLFGLVQTPSMVAMSIDHFAQADSFATSLETLPPSTTGVEISAAQATAELREPFPLWGLIVALVIIHFLHVAGGLVPLTVTTRRAMHGAYDHEHHAPVKRVAMYWHFLDVVWLVMFTIFLATG